MSPSRSFALFLTLILAGCDRVSLEEEFLSCDSIGWAGAEAGTVSATIDDRTFTTLCVRAEAGPGALSVTATDGVDPAVDRRFVALEIPLDAGSWELGASPADGEVRVLYARSDRSDHYFSVVSGAVEVEAVTDDEVRGAFEFVLRNEGGDPTRVRGGRFRVDR